MLTTQDSTIVRPKGSKASATGEIEQRLKRSENSASSYGASISLRFPGGLESIHHICDEIALYARYLKNRSLSSLWLLDIPHGPDSLLAITEISYQISARLNRITSGNAIFGIELPYDFLEPAKLSLVKGLGINNLLVKLDSLQGKLPALPSELLKPFQQLFFKVDIQHLANTCHNWLTELVHYNPVGFVTEKQRDASLVSTGNSNLMDAGFTPLQEESLLLPRQVNQLVSYTRYFKNLASKNLSNIPKEWLAIGQGATGFIDNYYVNTASPEVYEQALHRLELPVEKIF